MKCNQLPVEPRTRRPVPLPPFGRRGSCRSRGSILVLVMAVLGLLLILGTVFITVTATDRASTSNLIRATQADLAAKAAVNSAAEAIRRSLFDPSGQYVLTGGLRTGPAIQYQCLDNNNNPAIFNMPNYAGYPDTRYNGKACSANITVGQYMDLPDPDFDYWLTSIVDSYNPPTSYEKFQNTDPPAPGVAVGAAVIRNVARIGVPISPNPDEWKTRNPPISHLFTDVNGRVHRDFRYPANCRNVPMFVNNQPNPDLVDVDQDGIAEGIWCVLPIGSSGGEQWEAAFKIIDLSGLVNVNTAIRPVRPENINATNGSIGGEVVDLMDSSINPAEANLAKALGRYQTGAETNGFLYGPFISSLSTNTLNSPTNPGPYETIGFYKNQTTSSLSPDLLHTNTQMWSLLGVALNPQSAVYMNSFKLADELEFRYRGGLSGRVPRAATSDTWPVYQTGRSNVYTLLDTLPPVGPNNPNPGIVARPYLTAFSAVANYMVGDPRSTIEGTGNLTANVRDGTIRGTWSSSAITRQADAGRTSTSTPPLRKSLNSILDDISAVKTPSAQLEKAARINSAMGRQFRISMDTLVCKYLSSNNTDARQSILTELADGFRFALDGYLDNTAGIESKKFVGNTPSGVNPMDQMAAHLAANLISLSDSDNTPVVFTYNGPSATSNSTITVVGIPQFPVIQDVSDENDAGKPQQEVTFFNPWDTDISPQTMVLMDDIDGGNLVELSPTATPAITIPSIPAYDSITVKLPEGKKFIVRGDPSATPPKDAKPVYLAHKKKTVDGHYIVVDAWNRDLLHKPRPTRQLATNIPDGSLTGPKGCTGLFSVDVAGVTPLTKCDIHLTKPHHSLLNGSYTQTNNPPYSLCSSNTSVYLPYRSRWTSPADINRIPTFGGVIPTTGGTPPTLSYNGTITFADQATQCQIAATQGRETGKIDLLRTGSTIPQYQGGNLTMNCGYDKLTPGQRFFMYFSKIDPLTDGFGDKDINESGKVVEPQSHLETKLYGLININTAPASVLKFLPWTNSLLNDSLVKPFGFVRNDSSALHNDISQKIINYRNQLNRGITGNLTSGTPGFLSIAELLNIPMAKLVPTAADTAYDLDYRAGNWWGAMNYTTNTPPPSEATPLPPTSLIATGRIGPDSVRGDWAKRDLLFRNVCGMVTTRSDTFAVYVVVRSRNIVTNQVSTLRWVYAIVDRSQVRSSRDAPLVYGPYDNTK